MTRNKDHWAELILDSVGDDSERAREYYTEYKKWMKNTFFEIIVMIGLIIFFAVGTVGIMYLTGNGKFDELPDSKDLVGILFLIVGAILGIMMVFARDGMESKLKRRMENIEYHERKREEEQCK